jgi:threonylcarbamoyladenosine tRNA methylthiotransferase MtaB
MRIGIVTLGCKVNQSESASIEGILKNNNYEVVEYSDHPDICIVNTCTVTAKSDYQSRQLIRKAVKSGAKVIVTGCYAQLRPEEISKVEGVKLVLGNSEKNNLLNYIEKLSNNITTPLITVNTPHTPLNPQPYYSNRSRAFLKIQDGCNFACSYCTVPMARGRSRSLDEKHVLNSIEYLVKDGYREVVLTGIHIGSYGLDLKPKNSLVNIVKKILKSFPEIQIRLSSIEPQEFKDDFLHLINEGNVCPHLHIPLQNGSDKILRAMNRGYDTSFYKQLINRIVTACPEISVGTDVIVGFPGETEKDFNNTVKFIEQLPLTYLHVFPYSKRPHTEASQFTDQVRADVKKARVKRLLEISQKLKNAYMIENLGRILNVIVEQKDETTGFYRAISDNYLRVFIQSDSLQPGQSLKVKVISLTDNNLITQPV